MFSGTKQIDAATEALNKAYQSLLQELVEETATRIIEVTEEFATGETDFEAAIHVAGPDGDHSLITVEEEIAYYLLTRPTLVDVMKISEEFDNEAPTDLWKAARAMVNESLRIAEMRWEEKYPSDKPSRFR